MHAARAKLLVALIGVIAIDRLRVERPSLARHASAVDAAGASTPTAPSAVRDRRRNGQPGRSSGGS